MESDNQVLAAETGAMATIPSAIPAAYHRDVTRAVAICKEEGCRAIYVFGSVVAGSPGIRSDLDLAVRGCPPERYYGLLGRLMEEVGVPVDLIDLDSDTRIADYLEREGQLIHVG
ncbi:MAG: nucleotidyltransferase domain-containing protein [Gemmatimonadales bacterium]|nr:nucleotidyltransferase domain-containing protein [Gemmatimonadales bacterium]MBT3774425.1 nucleotidyltransferase domain-containing protein [Gemmatimonadales bacterium]MBT4187150.1 nucleotidyltransferase domain-containing protein [Gemmatimonadales bacterium]